MNDTIQEVTPIINSHFKTEQIKSNSFIIILLSILLLISVLIAGFFAWQTQNLVKQIQVLNNVKPTTIALATPTSVPMIPSTFKINRTSKEFALNFPDDCTQGEKYIECNNDKFSILIDTKVDGVGTSGKDDVKIIDLNGDRWKRFSINSDSVLPTSVFSAYDNNLNLNSNNYFIGVYYKVFSTEAQNYFEKILSTIKYIDATANSSPLPVACTMDVKICPDGSTVGRSGPKCEFTTCPTFLQL